ncbi:hypothetical protein D3C78_1252740 [compost metagenome]
MRKFLNQLVNDMFNIPLGHCRLVRNDKTILRKLKRGNILFPFNQMDTIGSNANRSFRLRVSLLADIDNMIALFGFCAYEVMCPRYVRTCRIYDRQPLFSCTLANLRRYAVRGEDNGSLLYLLQNLKTVRSIERNSSFLLEGFRYMGIMDNHS